MIPSHGVPTLASSFHPAIDRVRLNANDRLVGITLVRECSNGTGEFFRDRSLPIFPALRVVVPHAKEAVGSVREVVACDAGDLLAAEAGLNAEPKGDLLLGRLRLVDERCDLVVLVALAEPDPLSVSFGVVVKSHSSFCEVTLLKSVWNGRLRGVFERRIGAIGRRIPDSNTSRDGCVEIRLFRYPID